MYGAKTWWSPKCWRCLWGVGTVLRLERDAWSMGKWLRQAANDYAAPQQGVSWQSAYRCDNICWGLRLGSGDHMYLVYTVAIRSASKRFLDWFPSFLLYRCLVSYICTYIMVPGVCIILYYTWYIVPGIYSTIRSTALVDGCSKFMYRIQLCIYYARGPEGCV